MGNTGAKDEIMKPSEENSSKTYSLLTHPSSKLKIDTGYIDSKIKWQLNKLPPGCKYSPPPPWVYYYLGNSYSMVTILTISIKTYRYIFLKICIISIHAIAARNKYFCSYSCIFEYATSHELIMIQGILYHNERAVRL